MSSSGFRLPLRQLEENPVALREAKVDDKEFAGLRDSIKREGVILPIAVTTIFQGDGKTPKTTEDGLPVYRIIDGLQRYTASKELGLADIPVSVIAADDARVEKLQLIANAQRVRTKPAELAAHLNRIMGRDPTRTVAELGAELGFSSEWLGKILSLNEIKNVETLSLIDSGKICVANAAELAKLPSDEQDAFVKDAVQDVATVFSPKIRQRIKEIKDAKRAARDPNAVTGFVYEPHLRVKAEVMAEQEKPNVIIALGKASGLTLDPAQVSFVLKWILSMDNQSVEVARAKYEQRKAEREEENVRRKAERDAQRAAESAKAAAAVAK